MGAECSNSRNGPTLSSSNRVLPMVLQSGIRGNYIYRVTFKFASSSTSPKPIRFHFYPHLHEYPWLLPTSPIHRLQTYGIRSHLWPSTFIEPLNSFHSLSLFPIPFYFFFFFFFFPPFGTLFPSFSSFLFPCHPITLMWSSDVIVIIIILTSMM